MLNQGRPRFDACNPQIKYLQFILMRKAYCIITVNLYITYFILYRHNCQIANAMSLENERNH